MSGIEYGLALIFPCTLNYPTFNIISRAFRTGAPNLHLQRDHVTQSLIWAFLGLFSATPYDPQNGLQPVCRY